jgi:hypothetical protein
MGKAQVRILLLILICLGIGTGCSNQRVFLVGEDDVSLPQRKIPIVAKLQQRSIFLKDIQNQPIDFRLRTAPTKTQLRVVNEITDDEGEATAEIFAPVPGIYEIEARYAGNDRYRPGDDVVILLAVQPGKPVLVLDLDNTLTRGNWLTAKPEPIPYDQDTVRVVNELSRKYAIIYLSARPKPLHKQTRLWLRKYKFPEGPILLWFPSRLRWLYPSRYKRYELINLRESGISVRVGITNTEGDAEAYQKAGLKPLILGKNTHYARCVRNWAEIETLLLKQGY